MTSTLESKSSVYMAELKAQIAKVMIKFLAISLDSIKVWLAEPNEVVVEWENRIGSDNALDLPYTAEAPFNSYAKQHEPICLPDTRVDLLQQIYSWADRQDERSIFLVKRFSWHSKVHDSRYFCSAFEKGRLGASLFFSWDGRDVGHASKLVTSISIKLIISIQLYNSASVILL